MDVDKKRQLISNNDTISIRRQCELLDFNKSSYYYEPVALSNTELHLLNLIDEIYTMHPYYGTRRMAKELEGHSVYVGRDKIRSCYRILGLEAIYPKPNLSKHNTEHKVYPYLLRNVAIIKANQVWSADITYIRLTKGFVYLVAIIDWYSRYILSWRLSNSLHHDFCVDALQEALSNFTSPLIFNTDQGSQFTALDWINELSVNDIKISMDGRGRALDNIFIERFWRSLKQEKIYLSDLQSIADASVAISEYMLFYNNMRKHQSLNYRVPFEVYGGK